MARNLVPDMALWRRAMHDVRPLPSRSVLPPVEPAEKRAVSPPPPLSLPTVPALPPSPLDRAAGYDRANAERLKRGKHNIDARIDLHGMTQDEAHRTLAAFIRGARTAGKRCVLVITGRGRAGGGVLKTAVPRWLDEPEFRAQLLAIAPAQPRDGGNGALYVMLRRTRTG